MKKLFLVLAAAFAMVACQTDINEVGVAGGEVDVTFEVGTPTRAYSDGKTATVLQYAVYEGETELTALTRSVKGNNPDSINISKTVSFKLVTGNTYTVIFWAAAPNAPYTVDFEHKTMTVDYSTAVCNDENRDAFFKKHTFTVNGAQTETIELKRPFAQLNIGTNDYAAATQAGYTPEYSAVTVKNIYSTLNLWDATVGGETEVDFGYAAIAKTETFPVAGYEYLAMNYLLVPADKHVVDIEFGYGESSTAAEKTRIVGSVPVQRNYRTNIYGQLLTSDVDINIEIKPEYKEPAHEADALFHAAAFGGEVTLTEDVVLTTPLEVVGKMTINLNGKTISARYSKSVGAIIKNSGTLTIIGGTISSLGENGGSAIQNNGTMVVTDATLNGAPQAGSSWPSYTVNNTGNLTLNDVMVTSYHGAVASYGNDAVVTLNDSTIDMQGIPGFTSHGIYTYNNGKVVVNGGTYINHATDQNSTGGSVINGAVTVNSGNFSGRIENYYGTPVLKGGNYTVNPTRFVAAGYKAIEKNGKYYVVADNVELVASATELQNALAAGSSILLYEDVNVSKLDLTALTNDVVIDANGKTITTTNSYGVQVTAGKNITLKNAKVVMTKAGDYITYAAGFKVENGDYQGKTITLKDCEIRMCNTDWAYAVNMPASVKNLNLVIDGCTLEGAVAFQCWGDNNTITATNSHFICNYTTSAMYTSYCVALQGDGTNNSENNKLNISGCEFSYSGVDNFNSPIKAVYNSSKAINNTITVVDCTYDNKVIAY